MPAYVGQSDRAGTWRGHLTYFPDVGKEVGETLKYAAKTNHTYK